MQPLLPWAILFGAVLIAGWALWQRNDPDVRSQWQPLTLLVLRQVLLFVVIGAVLLQPRLLPLIFTGALAAFGVWWWLRRR